MMEQHKLKNIVIVGGGTAGWMTASALAKSLKGQYDITLVESDQIGTIGVGEATIPMINLFNRMLELDEDEFMRQTEGTFKLGIEFVDWGRVGDRYYHGFGVIGQDTWTVDFHQYWLKQYLAGKAPELDHYSLNNVASMHNKFMRAQADLPNSPLAQIVHAYQFDASLYAKFLRDFSEQRGVRRIEGKIAEVQLRDADGHIAAVVLEDGRRIEGDLFIDCSGFRALLIEGALKTGYEEWSHWLPCDTAVAVPCASAAELTPFTRATARGAGWQWRIPLQHRIGNGHVFSSKYMSEDEATAILMSNLDGEPLAEPRPVRFRTGKRNRAWNKNCVSIGLSCGFIEPLESTSIHLFQRSVLHLVQNFPFFGIKDALVDHYNARSLKELEYARDFVILHYKLNQRDDSAFWKDRAAMSVPDSLQARIDLFRSSGGAFQGGGELFRVDSWVQVMMGQRLEPQGWHRLGAFMNRQELGGVFDGLKKTVDHTVDAMMTHDAFLKQYCASSAA